MENYYDYLIAVGQTILLLILMFLDIKKENTSNPTPQQKKSIKRLILAIALVGITITWSTTFKNVKEEKENKAEISSLKSDLHEHDSTNKELNKEIKALQSQQIKALSENYAILTGGKSFCKIVYNYDKRGGVSWYTLVHKGKYPLKDVVVEVEDLGRMQAYRDSISKTRYWTEPDDMKSKSMFQYSFNKTIYPKQKILLNIPITFAQKSLNIKAAFRISGDRLVTQELTNDTAIKGPFRFTTRSRVYENGIVIDSTNY